MNYFSNSQELLFRRIQAGGESFIDHYLEKFSERETESNFNLRKSLTPSAAFAKKEVINVQNAIYQRLTDITRYGGSDSYQRVVAGKDNGIDLDHSSMSHFIGQDVLSEMLFMGTVGVLVDMPVALAQSAIEDAHPYCYIYKFENIVNYSYDNINGRKTLTALLLSEEVDDLNEYGLPTNSTTTKNKLFNLDGGGVRLRVFEKDKITMETVLEIPEIPFVFFSINNSLLHETGRYQVALMNMESSDINYALKANFPFYVEQAQAAAGSHLKKEEEIEVGNIQGRQYIGDKEPGFINPSAEPLRISMAKQEQIKASIKEMINVAVSSIAAKSAESKQLDERGLEAGLSAIGEILEHGERKLAVLFAAYEGSREVATINYPDRYSLKSDKDRLDEVEQLQRQKEEIPSLRGKKALCKMAAHTLFDTKLSVSDLKIIDQEIDNANNTGASAKLVVADVEAGILGKKTAALMRGYQENEPTLAATEHADRLARIEEAQTRSRLNTENYAARGLTDKAPDKQDAKEEKKESQDPTTTDNGKKKVRGEGNESSNSN